MKALAKPLEVEGEPAKKMVAAEAKLQIARVLVAVAALLSGLSITMPVLMRQFIFPLRWAQISSRNGSIEGDTWEPYVITGRVVSLDCGLTSILLAARSRAIPHHIAEGRNVRASLLASTRIDVIMRFGMVAWWHGGSPGDVLPSIRL